MSEFDLPSGGADYGFDDKDSFSLGSENVSATGPSGGSGGTDSQFFGDDSVNVMDFGRGSVSNISDTSSFDPNFAALQMIGRGLTPSSALRNQISFDVPSQMLPQLEGRLGPVGPKFYSEAERFLQEDFTDFVQSGPGIVGLIGNFLSDNFNDAKKALGLDGSAKGGLKDEDFTGLMGTRDDQQISDMSQQGAGMVVTDPVVPAPTPVAMGAVPQVSPLFDQFGNPYRSGFDRNMAEMAQQSLSGGIASVAPNQAQEVGDAMRDTFVTTTPNLNLPGFRSKSMSKEEADRVKENLEKNNPAYQQMSDASTFNILQGLGTKFNPQINEILRQNVSPNLRFESDIRPDVNDPDKFMPYMGLRYDFSTA